MGASIDRAAFLATFKAEAEDHLATLGRGLLQLEKQPAGSETIDALFRAAHTLKGAARMMGYGEIQSGAHDLEELFDEIRSRRLAATSGVIDRALTILDEIQVMLEHVLRDASTPAPRDTGAPAPPRASGTSTPRSADRTAPGSAAPTAQRGIPSPERAAAPPAPPVRAAASDAGGEYIRVPIRRVNALLNLAGELGVNKVKSAHKLAALRRLTRHVKASHRRLAQLTDEVRVRLPAHAGGAGTVLPLMHECQLDAEDLRREIAELADRLSSDVLQLDPVVEELQFRVKGLRMLPCATVFDGCERIVRDIAHQEGKAARLIVRGEETELDKHILEAVKPCLLHLLRNAVSHGIEPPGERTTAGKPEIGVVELTAAQRGARIVIEVHDDGRGIDRERLKERALVAGVLTREQLAAMDEPAVLDLVFAPGLSTSETVTDVSGRGVGLDVVRREVERLKGEVRVASSSAGTRVTIDLPLTVAAIEVLVVEAGGHRFGLPLDGVEETRAVAASEIQTIDLHMALLVREETVPLVRLTEVLAIPASGAAGRAGRSPAPDPLRVVIGTGRDYRLGFIVDRICGQEEVLLKSLGPHAGRPATVSGAAVLASGEAIVVLDLAALMVSARGAQVPGGSPAMVAAQAPRRILVVEDSLTTRELERSILEAHGYVVETAIDGLDALEKIARRDFALVVSDIQMPRMDGFQFCQALRAQPGHQSLPLVFVTSVDTDEERRRGLEVGAQAYIVKRAFDQSALIETIERLIG